MPSTGRLRLDPVRSTVARRLSSQSSLAMNTWTSASDGWSFSAVRAAHVQFRVWSDAVMCIHLTLLTLSCSHERRSSQKEIGQVPLSVWTGAEMCILPWSCFAPLIGGFSPQLGMHKSSVWWDAVTCISVATRSSRTCFVAGFAQVEERRFAHEHVEMRVSSEGVVFN